MTSSVLPQFYQPPTMHGYASHPHAPPRAFIASSTPRYGTHGQNSAQSAANPDEDWTKISDLAERRRIQNRIAQRNYRERKKLKRRLEDLERRANSDSPPPGAGVPPSAVGGSLAGQQDYAGLKRRTSKSGPLPVKRSPSMPQGPFGASPNPNDYSANSLYPARRDSRQASITPPPSMTHSNNSNTTSPSMPVYQQQPPAAHNQQPPYYGNAYSDAAYSSLQPPVLPPPAGLGLTRLGEQPEAWQPHKPYGGDEMFGQFGMSSHYPANTAAPYETGIHGVTTGYPEQAIYTTPSMY